MIFDTHVTVRTIFSIEQQKISSLQLTYYDVLQHEYSLNILCGINYAIFSFKKDLCDDFYERHTFLSLRWLSQNTN